MYKRQSLDSRINIGDIVVSTEVIQHDLDVTDLGYKPGDVPGTGKVFTSDKLLHDLAVSCSHEANPDVTVYEGLILTGDQFISGQEKKNWLIDTFHGLCAEMEGGAIAHVASLNEVPFLIIRSISDKAEDVYKRQILDSISCYLRLLFLNSITNTWNKNIIQICKWKFLWLEDKWNHTPVNQIRAITLCCILFRNISKMCIRDRSMPHQDECLYYFSDTLVPHQARSD